MRFGLRKLTLLDYPGKVACTVFTGGCNFRCPFCHNASLVNCIQDELELDRDGLLEFLNQRKKVLDGVCVTGGEPLLHAELPNLLMDIKRLGLSVKLDTNGAFPGRLKAAVSEGMVDMVAMDIKNCPAKYDMTSGVSRAFDAVAESLEYLLTEPVSYEFRTTVAGGFHEPEDFVEIGKLIKGKSAYFLQKFENSGDILHLDEKMGDISAEFLAECLKAVRPFVPNAALRGV